MYFLTQISSAIWLLSSNSMDCSVLGKPIISYRSNLTILVTCPQDNLLNRTCNGFSFTIKCSAVRHCGSYQSQIKGINASLLTYMQLSDLVQPTLYLQRMFQIRSLSQTTLMVLLCPHGRTDLIGLCLQAGLYLRYFSFLLCKYPTCLRENRNK